MVKMKNRIARSEWALIQMLVTLVLALGVLVWIGIWKIELVKRVYFVDVRTILLNGFIFLIFISGVIHLVRAYVHCRFEEIRVEDFIHDKENGEFLPENLIPESLIARRYDTIKDLYDRNIPINHGAIASSMVAEESLYQSYPRFVNNVLILSGVFGTIVSLIIALVGAGIVLEADVAGEGMGVMLSGMNTALTTTATAIVCFFLYTYFYQRLADIQIYVFGRVEEAVQIHIVPEFAFDSEAVNYKTEKLIKQLGGIVTELKKGSDFILTSLDGLNQYNQAYLEKVEDLIIRQDNQLVKTEDVLVQLEKIKGVLIDGFRLNN
jgi:hypothetical protein